MTLNAQTDTTSFFNNENIMPLSEEDKDSCEGKILENKIKLVLRTNG